MYKTIIVSLLMLTLVSCGRQNLRSDYYNRWELTVEQDYQAVYQNLLERIRERQGKGYFGGEPFIIENDFYPDTKRAVIRSWRDNRLFGEYLPSRIEIESLSDNKTKVSVYSSRHGFAESITKEAVERWVYEETE